MAKNNLEIGTVLKGIKSQYTIVKRLKEGSQGGVYRAVDMNKKDWAIKWYWKFDKDQKQRIDDLYAEFCQGKLVAVQNLRECEFVFPKDKLQNSESFGYVMELQDLSKCVNHENIMYAEKPIDYMTIIQLSINLCKGFDKLHTIGHCYKDINKGNVFFNLNTNKVTIIDVDNIRFEGANEESAVIGTPGFIAPEIIRKEASPDKYADRFAVSVILFILWCRTEPFCGIKEALYDGKNILNDLYANPVFIFDPIDKSNSAEQDPQGHKGYFQWARNWWAAMPKLLKDKFMLAFTNGLKRNDRFTEANWIKTFEQIINDNLLEKCKCGNYISKDCAKCIFCGEAHSSKAKESIEPVIKKVQTSEESQLPKHKINTLEVFDGNKLTKVIPIEDGKIISGMELSTRLKNIDKFIQICHKPDNALLYAIRNLTMYSLTIYFRNSEEKRQLESGKAVLLRNVQRILLPANICLDIY